MARTEVHPPPAQGCCGDAVGSALEAAAVVAGSYAFGAAGAPAVPLGFGIGISGHSASDVAGTSGLIQDTGGGMTGEPEAIAPPAPVRLPPNLMVTPAQSVSTWASSRTVEPRM